MIYYMASSHGKWERATRKKTNTKERKAMLIMNETPAYVILVEAKRENRLGEKGKVLLAKIEEAIGRIGRSAAYVASDGIFTLRFPYGASEAEVVDAANEYGDEITAEIEQAEGDGNVMRSLSHVRASARNGVISNCPADDEDPGKCL